MKNPILLPESTEPVCNIGSDKSLSILHISDTINMHCRLNNLPPADILIHSGDATMCGSEYEVLNFFEWFVALPHRHKIFVPGEKDLCLQSNMVAGLPENVHCLMNSEVRIGNVRFYGLPFFIDDVYAGKYDEEISKIPNNVDILISHQPPLGILDKEPGRGKRHYGSKVLYDRVRKEPIYHLFGHVNASSAYQGLVGPTYINSAMSTDSNVIVEGFHKFLFKSPDHLIEVWVE